MSDRLSKTRKSVTLGWKLDWQADVLYHCTAEYDINIPFPVFEHAIIAYIKHGQQRNIACTL